MNIEDLIREANPVRPGDVEDAFSPGARSTLAAILREDALPGPADGRAAHAHSGLVPPGQRARHGPSPRSRKRRMIMVGVAAVAAGATAAGLLLAVPSPAPTAVPEPKAHPSATSSLPQYTTARQVLLTAAANVTGAATSGRYWRLQEVSGKTWPGGTEAHPYDISVSVSFDQWNPRSPGSKNWDMFQEHGTVPATPADAAAWRAAGSPTSWRSGRTVMYPSGARKVGLSTTTTHSLRGASWDPGNGIVGYVEGNEKGLTASQFAAMPTTQSGVLATLRRYYSEIDFDRDGQPCANCSSEDAIVWNEALHLLQDPVSAQVRSATYKVMASLPGVRSIGPVTDPLGRSGYGLMAAPDPASPRSPYADSESVAVIDPQTGSLLALEDVGMMPRSVQCQTKVGGQCVGPAFTGRSYQGQVQDYTALVSAGWTDASPTPPPSSTWQDSTAVTADPTTQSVPCDQTGCGY
jgi:hypothetical protein